MSARIIGTAGIAMPDDFPSAQYVAVHERFHASRVPDRQIPTLGLGAVEERRRWFGGAWTAVAWRFRACADHDEAFTRSVARHGNVPAMEERYLQERELFNFFMNG